MEKIIVIIIAVLLIGFILWWFFGRRTQDATRAGVSAGVQHAVVTVDGGYLPNTVVLRQGVPAQIVFNRKDSSSCLSHVVFPDFGINKELPVGENYPIDIDTSQAGEYQYACGMNMFHGKVVIKK